MPGMYGQLLDAFDAEHANTVGGTREVASTDGRVVPDSLVATIERDIHRTFPHFALFSTTGSVGASPAFDV